MEIEGPGVVLRDATPADVDTRLSWLSAHRAWADWDAPWEPMDQPAPEALQRTRERWLTSAAEPLPDPRERLFVQAAGGPLLGWVNQYKHDPTNATCYVGIDLCDEAWWGRGCGSAALAVWVGYLFEALDLHRIALDTWSGNARMCRCAEKCGFVLESRRREAVVVRGWRYDGVGYGLLRREWLARR